MAILDNLLHIKNNMHNCPLLLSNGSTFRLQLNLQTVWCVYEFKHCLDTIKIHNHITG